ncbi:hypothetical protein NDU88_007567 [Pleurodeles waltl]|uniref:Uncharacterized protein n=1 Tax=Pleurodeles waltl TaxID=8319 RepID=A0AAV7N4G3_PLEWA|nr:hypothetical protein NDU88_007567 [Pleurodeles waltl]
MGRNKTKPPGLEEYEQQRSTASEDSIACKPSECFLSSRAETSGDKLDLILQEIHDSRVIMEQRRAAITTDLSLLKDDQHKLVSNRQSKHWPP